MNYTEKEKKGIDKVENMNKFFDKVLMPAIGVLIILTLLTFIINGLMDKFGGSGKEQNTSSSLSAENVNSVPKEFQLRSKLLENYDKYSAGFTAYGYEPAEGYSQDLALCKTVDEELVIYQFVDSKIGYFTILRYTPSESDENSYKSLSLTVSSSTLINVTVTTENRMYTVAFTSTDFMTYSKNDNVQYNKMMNMVSVDELEAMYDIFETDINNLAESCGIA